MALLLHTLAIMALLALPGQEVNSARILSVAFMSSRSHKITYEPLLYELAKRGHQVTILNPFISGKPRENIREIQTIDIDAFYERGGMPNMFEMKENNVQLSPFLFTKILHGLCNETYDLPQVQSLQKEKFDLVIMSAIFNECVAGFVHKFNTSLVLVSPAVVFPMMSSILGTPSPPSFVPNLFSRYSDSMTFTERTINLLVDGLLRAAYAFHIEPTLEALYREKLNDPSLPGAVEVYRNASLILSNSHVSLGRPRPFMPDIIEVGGMHCRPEKPVLPKDLGDFLDNSGPEGFIYFSMGSALKGKDMPERMRKIFLATFSKLKQKILWKWETEKMDDLPKNVKLSKWVPQQDVLGHPKIKAFITHGGFGGTTEAVYHGVPLVAIPMFGDQMMNMEKAELAGYAIALEYETLSEEKLTEALNKVMTEPKYKENVKKLSSLFRDQPDKPLDRAVFWTEYVLRHKGAMHLRSAARELNFFQYHSIDVVAFLVTVTAVILYAIFAVLRFIARKVCGCGGGKSSKRSGVTNGSANGSKKRN